MINSLPTSDSSSVDSLYKVQKDELLDQNRFADYHSSYTTENADPDHFSFYYDIFNFNYLSFLSQASNPTLVKEPAFSRDWKVLRILEIVSTAIT